MKVLLGVQGELQRGKASILLQVWVHGPAADLGDSSKLPL